MIGMSFKLTVAAAIALAVNGCAMIPPAPFPGEVSVDHNGLYYSYYEPLGGTVRYANTQPQDLSGLQDDTQKALAVLGFPSMKDWPAMTFTTDMPRNAGEVQAAKIRNGKYGDPAPGESVGAADAAISAGLGDAAPGAALGAAAIFKVVVA